MSKEVTDITVIEENVTSPIIRPVVSAGDLLSVQKEQMELIRKGLRQGVDYGVIPKTNDKKVLLKPGAERLCAAYGMRQHYDIISEEIDYNFENEVYNRFKKESQIVKGLYRYVVSCTLMNHDGKVFGQAMGECSSLESKYSSRPHDVSNTILKMAQKRALVAACLNTFGISDMFTQDLNEEEEITHDPASENYDNDNKAHKRMLVAALDLNGIDKKEYGKECVEQISGQPFKEAFLAYAKEIHLTDAKWPGVSS